jgi:hypothetical protein
LKGPAWGIVLSREPYIAASEGEWPWERGGGLKSISGEKGYSNLLAYERGNGAFICIRDKKGEGSKTPNIDGKRLVKTFGHENYHP